MGGEPSSSRGQAADLERIASALGARFRVGSQLPWGQTVPYFAAEADIGRIAIAAFPFCVSRDDGTSDAFHDAAFELVELTGRGLPTVFRHGVASGVPYFAYRMPRGRTLAERIAEGPFTSRGVLRIAEGLLEALTAAHRHGLVHGELSPKNVLIEERGEKVHVTLLGTGLTHVTRALRAVNEARTSGFAPALSSYLAPELLSGEDPSIASDVYALGALLHHIVCGRPPSGFDSKESYEDVPSLVDVIARSRETEPSLRYESAAAMRAAIDWVEIESERQNAQTQDIPLWMEMSVVANIPVTDLIRGKGQTRSSQPPPPRSSEPPPRSKYGAVPLPVAPHGRTSTPSPRVSGSFSIPRAPRLPVITEELAPSTRVQLDETYDVDVDLDATPVAPSLLRQQAVPEPTRSHVGRWISLGLILAVSIAGFLLLFLD